MEWEIQPYEAFGPIRFGMGPAEVAAILGPPSGRRRLSAGKVREGWTIAVPRVFYVEDKVIEIEFPYDAGSPIYNEVSLFRADRQRVRRLLAGSDDQIFEGPGVHVFFGLGLSTNIFHRIDETAESLSAFARGYWDDAMNILKQTSLPAASDG